MAVHHSELTPVELEFFADESKRVCLLHVMKGDRMMAEKVKLSSTCDIMAPMEHPVIHGLTTRRTGGPNLAYVYLV